jgi:hypothetical protein
MPDGRGEQRASMTPKRLLTFTAVLACLVLAAPAAADDGGGVSVQTFDETGGGILAPTPETTATEAPVAEAAQDETPTTPEGEEQPPDEENGEETVPDDEEIIGPVNPPGDDGGGAGEPAGGSLPHTGLQLAALTAIGLGLLLAGGALRPTSSWPPPRDRLSRSPSRR